MVFSSVRCSFLLARSSPSAAHCCTGAEISQTPWFPHFCGAARDFRFMLLCVEPRVIWRPCWNEILTIFDPYTFSHTQGQGWHRIPKTSWLVDDPPYPDTAACMIAVHTRRP